METKPGRHRAACSALPIPRVRETAFAPRVFPPRANPATAAQRIRARDWRPSQCSDATSRLAHPRRFSEIRRDTHPTLFETSAATDSALATRLYHATILVWQH